MRNTFSSKTAKMENIWSLCWSHGGEPASRLAISIWLCLMQPGEVWCWPQRRLSSGFLRWWLTIRSNASVLCVYSLWEAVPRSLRCVQDEDWVLTWTDRSSRKELEETQGLSLHFSHSLSSMHLSPHPMKPTSHAFLSSNVWGNALFIIFYPTCPKWSSAPPSPDGVLPDCWIVEWRFPSFCYQDGILGPPVSFPASPFMSLHKHLFSVSEISKVGQLPPP